MEGEAALPAVGEVRVGDRPSLPFFVTAGAGDEVEAISAFLTPLALCDVSPLTCRSYAHELLRWWRLLTALGMEWTEAGGARSRPATSRSHGAAHRPCNDQDVPIPIADRGAMRQKRRSR